MEPLPLIQRLEPDYLIIGAGAMAMAFAEELITQDHRVMYFAFRGDYPGLTVAPVGPPPSQAPDS